VNAEATGPVLVLDLASRVTQRVAPDELYLVAELSRDLPELAGRRRRRGSILDFGIDGVAAVLSPAVVVVANAVLSRTADRTGDAIVDGSAKLGRRLARRLGLPRGRRAGPLVTTRPGAPGQGRRLSVAPARSADLRRLVRRCARRAGLSRDQARLLEAAFLAELADRREDG
jgi:hypothetical protein